MTKVMGYILGLLNALIVVLLSAALLVPKSNQDKINKNIVRIAEVKTDLNGVKNETIPTVKEDVNQVKSQYQTLTAKYDKLNDKIDNNFRETNKTLNKILMAVKNNGK